MKEVAKFLAYMYLYVYVRVFVCVCYNHIANLNQFIRFVNVQLTIQWLDSVWEVSFVGHFLHHINTN